MIITTRLTLAVIIAAALVGLALGGLIGASVTMARMADQVTACHELRAESYALNAQTYEATILNHEVLGEWICAARGVCR